MIFIIIAVIIPAMITFLIGDQRRLTLLRRQKESSLKQISSLKGIESPLILDTSIIMDGRFLELFSFGLANNSIIIPREVLRELQYVADHAETLKRTRARAGLDLINKLKNINIASFILVTEDDDKPHEVDDLLIYLGQKYQAPIFTLDYNLTKVADLEGVKVINLNYLVKSLQPQFIPGEVIKLKLLDKGESRGQAIGYIDNTIMCVVKNGSKYIGKEKEVRIENYMQTDSGRMAFAEIVSNTATSKVKKNSKDKVSSVIRKSGKNRDKNQDKKKNENESKNIVKSKSLKDKKDTNKNKSLRVSQKSNKNTLKKTTKNSGKQKTSNKSKITKKDDREQNLIDLINSKS